MTIIRCEHCDFRGKTKVNLDRHFKQVHVERKKAEFKCKHCDLVLSSKFAQYSHTNVVHFPDKYRCDVCRKSLGSNCALKDHRASHEEGKVRSKVLCLFKSASVSSVSSK